MRQQLRNLNLRQFVVDTELGAVAYSRLRGVDGVPTADVDLLIDGFPRSANTFAVQYLKLTNPSLQVVSHLHGVGALKRAARTKTPAVVLIRNPVDAVASLCVRDHFQIPAALRWYTRYYSRAFILREAVLPVTFERITSDVSGTFAQIAAASNLMIDCPVVDAELGSRLRAAVIEAERRFSGSVDPSRVSWPAAERREALQSVVDQITTRDYEQLLARARKLHHAWSDLSAEE